MIYPVSMTNYLGLEGEVQERSDEELLAASVSHPSLFAILVRKYEEAFMRKARSIVHEEEAAEDIVQEAFTKIYLNAKKFKTVEGATFSSWGYRILINTALTHYTRLKRQGARVTKLDEEIWNIIPDKTLRQFEKREVMDEVASVLSRMSPVFAKALSSFFIEGKSQEEMAKAEGVSVGAIKTRVHRAKKEFREVFKTITTEI
ncbi:MAG: RNA polymerase sigma-70 factor, ECF subfamily [Parcubacteria group bacterium Gr01-1014_56]|nr:MAG: RNA polymerase sigma-70 factor, ECF subfamily [Parcubacteria group bacterium Gr01-1014_56]